MSGCNGCWRACIRDGGGWRRGCGRAAGALDVVWPLTCLILVGERLDNLARIIKLLQVLHRLAPLNPVEHRVFLQRQHGKHVKCGYSHCVADQAEGFAFIMAWNPGESEVVTRTGKLLFVILDDGCQHASKPGIYLHLYTASRSHNASDRR